MSAVGASVISFDGEACTLNVTGSAVVATGSPAGADTGLADGFVAADTKRDGRVGGSVDRSGRVAGTERSSAACAATDRLSLFTGSSGGEFGIT